MAEPCQVSPCDCPQPLAQTLDSGATLLLPPLSRPAVWGGCRSGKFSMSEPRSLLSSTEKTARGPDCLQPEKIGRKQGPCGLFLGFCDKDRKPEIFEGGKYFTLGIQLLAPGKVPAIHNHTGTQGVKPRDMGVSKRGLFFWHSCLLKTTKQQGAGISWAETPSP